MSFDSSRPRRASKRWSVALLVLVLGLIAVPAASASTVLVQGTTDVRDAGLLADVIEPGFHAAYPQYDIKYIAVGSGQALKAAEAGQADVALVHSPSAEKPFVEKGYSLEPRGRAIFYSDYVIVGSLDDPAGVLAGAPHNAAKAYELVAKAGEEGKANFVSRGDASGTNTAELAIWKLTKVELNELGEPGPKGTKTNSSWYQKANLGQAETVQVANQCPFSGGGCYDLTDRGTFNRVTGNGSVTALKVVTEKNEAAAAGGANLLTNPFSVYIINPAKEPGVPINLAGATALADYLTSEAFQAGLASYPTTANPAFFADARPSMTASPTFSGTVPSGTQIRVAGSLANPLPGSPPVAGVPILLRQTLTLGSELVPTYTTVASGTTAADGSYSLSGPITHAGRLRVEMPTTTTYPSFAVTPLLAVGSLAATYRDVGELALPSILPPAPLRRAKVVLKRPTVRGRLVTLRGHLAQVPSRDAGAQLVVLGRKQGQRKLHSLRRLHPGKTSSYKVGVKLAPGKWKLRVKYRDPGAVLPATSRAVSVSVR